MKIIKLTVVIVGIMLCNIASAGFFDSAMGVVKGTLDLADAGLKLTSSIAGSGSDSETASSSSSSSVDEHSYSESYKTIKQMQDDYNTNSIAAAKKWQNKTVTLTLKFINIMDHDSILCECNGIGDDIMITFPITDHTQAAKLESGQYLKVEGIFKKPSNIYGSVSLKMRETRILNV